MNCLRAIRLVSWRLDSLQVFRLMKRVLGNDSMTYCFVERHVLQFYWTWKLDIRSLREVHLEYLERSITKFRFWKRTSCTVHEGHVELSFGRYILSSVFLTSPNHSMISLRVENSSWNSSIVLLSQIAWSLGLW